MKLFYDLSNLENSKTFRHDAQLLKGVQIGIVVFLILSSITVFSGVKSHLTTYLVDSFILWRWFVYASAFLIGSLGVDLVNTYCMTYQTSAILRKDFKSESIILICFCGLLTCGLTYYSFSMSQNSALVVGNDIEDEKQVDDSGTLTSIDSVFNNQLLSIEATYQTNHERTIEPFKNRINNISATYSNQIEILKNEIAVIDKNTTKDNYLYAAKQKKPFTTKIQSLEASKLLALSPVLTDQQAAIDRLTAQKDKMILEAKELHKEDRTRAKTKTDNHNQKATATSTVFTDMFGKLAGFAIFILLILTVIKEILFFRNEIEPEPILSNFDFSPSWMLEVVSYPVVWVRRHSVNKVRGWYEGLPKLKKPVIEDEILDGNSLSQSILKPDPDRHDLPHRSRSPSPNAPGQMPDYMPPGYSRNLQANQYYFASVPTGNESPVNTGNFVGSQYSHENEKFRGLENSVEVVKPTKTKTHEKEQKIKHVGQNDKEYWYTKKQVEGKIIKYAANVRTWTKKANRKKATNRDKEALVNNQRLLDYWENRIKEFII